MNKKTIPTLAALTATSFFAAQANAISLDISSVGDSGMQFGGDTSVSFFQNATGHVFEINDTDGGTGDATGLLGSISGMWTINPWVGNTTTLDGSAGVFTIWDADGETLTADIDFTKIGTVLSGGVINGATNLTNFAYAGSNMDLFDLYSAGSATLALSFEIANGPENLSLDYLSNNSLETTFSGDLVSSTPVSQVPDGGTTAAMLGFGMLATMGIARRVNEQKSKASA